MTADEPAEDDAADVPAAGAPTDLAGLGAEELDVDVLWRQLVAARDAGDHERVRAIEARMRELEATRRFAHLTDEELEQRIRALHAQRQSEDMLGHSPGGGPGGDSAGGEDTARLNRMIRANQHVGIERTLSALLDERERRRG